MKKWLQKIMPSKRKIMQLYFALLFNANLKGFSNGSIYQGDAKVFCAPGVNCYSCPGAVAACPLGSLQGAFSSPNHSTIYYILGILLLYCILFGRMLCGWACPFGLIGELLYKIKSPKLKKSPVTRLLSFFKYVVLVFFVLIVPITYAIRKVPLPAFCKYICPVGTIEGGLGLLSNKVNNSLFSLLGPLFTWKFMLMISVVVGSIFIFRLFCRFLCPLGALYGLFNKISVFGVKVDEEKCTHCNLCVAQCKVDIKHVGDQECIACGECIPVCPTKAISWKGPKIFVKPNEMDTHADPEAAAKAKQKRERKQWITRTISAMVLLGILIGAVAYFDAKAPEAPEKIVGNQVGDQLPSFQLEIVTADGITDKTIDPSATGKVTIINFWGTWCGPCVQELPYFDEIATTYADKVTVVAIHSNQGINTAPAYISKHYPDSNIVFAKDNEGSDAINGAFFTALGFRMTYPATVVVDANGVILYSGITAFHSVEDLLSVLPEDISAGAENQTHSESTDYTPALIVLGIMLVLGLGAFVGFRFYIRKK